MDYSSTSQYNSYSPPPGQPVYQPAPAKGPNLAAMIAVVIILIVAVVAAGFFFLTRGEDRADLPAPRSFTNALQTPEHLH